MAHVERVSLLDQKKCQISLLMLEIKLNHPQGGYYQLKLLDFLFEIGFFIIFLCLKSLYILSNRGFPFDEIIGLYDRSY